MFKKPLIILKSVIKLMLLLSLEPRISAVSSGFFLDNLSKGKTLIV